MQQFINEKLILVDGMTKSCIYDLEKCLIYHISNTLKDDILDFFVNKNNCEKFLKKHGILHKNSYLKKINYRFEDKINFAWIEITTSCNFFCRHCYNGYRKDNFLHYNDIEKIFAILNKIGVQHVQITGGEPLLHPNILEILALSKKLFKKVELFTNGYLLNDIIFSILKENEINMAISLHSLDAKQYDLITGVKNSFDIVYNNIKKAQKNGIKFRIVSIKTKITPNNIIIDNIPIKNDPVRVVGRANLSLLNKDILTRKLITEETFKKRIDPTFIIRNLYRHNCFGSKLYISSSGLCYPCVMERRLTVGNIFDPNLQNKIFDLGRRFSKSNITTCSNCEYRLACYDCRPDSLSDNPFQKTWYCTFLPEEGVWINKNTFVNNFFE